MKPVLAVAALTAGIVFAGAALAQPAGGGVRQACAADMQKFCADAKPGPGGGMRECMRSHFQDLSDVCKAAITQMRQSQGGAGGSGTAPPASDTPKPQ
jgi:hypothetical protein